MITLLLFFAKAKSIISTIASFILTHWRVFLVLAILAYTYYAFNKLQAQRDDAITALNHLNQSIERETIKRKAEDKIKRSIALKEIQISQEIHSKQLELVKNEYEKRNKINVNTIASLRNELREKVRSDTFAIPQVDTNTERTSEEWRNSYTTAIGQYQNLVSACKVTTLDYNSLREWADSACNQIGCE